MSTPHAAAPRRPPTKRRSGIHHLVVVHDHEVPLPPAHRRRQPAPPLRRPQPVVGLERGRARVRVRGVGGREGAEVGRLEDALDDAPDVPRDGVGRREHAPAVLRDERVMRRLCELQRGSA